MHTQGKAGRTAASRLGISIFDCTGKTLRQLREMVEAESLRASAGRRAEDRTMALEDSEIEEVTEPRKEAADSRTVELSSDDILTVPDERSRPADEEEIGGLLDDIRRISGRPPPNPEPKFIAARSDDSVLFDLGGKKDEGEEGSSVVLSLAELQRLGSERPPAEARPAPPKKAEPEVKQGSSVEMSLQELQGIEQERVASEEEEAARLDAERKEAEARRQAEIAEARRRQAEAEARAEAEAAMLAAEEELAREVDELLDSTAPEGDERSYRLSELEMLMLSDLLPEGQARWIIPLGQAETLDEETRLAALKENAPSIELAGRTYIICEESQGISRELAAVREKDGLRLEKIPQGASAEVQLEEEGAAPRMDWNGDYASYTLSGEEMTSASIVLPERAVRWILPVPDAGMVEEAAKAVMRRFKDEPRLSLGGKDYFVFASREGFAGARWCARTGNVMQMWADAGTQYDMEASLGGPAPVRVMDVIEPAKEIPWDKGHVRYMLAGDEYVATFSALPEKAVRWLIPAPEGEDKVSRSIRRKFSNDPRLRLGARTYYVYDGEDGFANARWCARTGNILNIWPQQMTDYDYEGSLGGASAAGLGTVEESEWPEKFFYHSISHEEAAVCSAIFPEGKPVLMHPAPPEDSILGSELMMLEELKKMGGYKVRLGGDHYFVVELEDVAVWKHMTVYCPKARLAAKIGDSITLWEDAGRSLFSGTTFNIYPSAQRGPPLPSEGGSVEPYENELLDIGCLYDEGRKSRYLYPLSERPGDMDVETFNNLLQISSADASRTRQSPLISVQGRWYFALEYAYVGARLTTLEGKALHVFPAEAIAASQADALERMRRRLAQKRKDNEPEYVSLPPDPSQRARIVTSFPSGEVCYLYSIDTSDPNYRPRDSDIIVSDDGKESVWRLTERPIPGLTMPVMRKGDRIYPVQQETQQERLPTAAPPPPPHRPTMQGMAPPLARVSPKLPPPPEDLAGAIKRAMEEPSEPGEQLRSDEIEIMHDAAAFPPRKPTMLGLAPARAEASEPTMEIHTAEIELVREDEGAQAPAGRPKPPKRSVKPDDSGSDIEIHTGEFEIMDDGKED